MNTQQKNSVLGVLISDAAAMGLHWLYDLERMHQVVGTDDPTFFTPNADHYEGQVGYFAHAGKLAGEQSHYGESYLLNLRHLCEQGKFDALKFQQDFIACFGPGGSFSGYIDSPTRVSLQNMQKIDFSNEDEAKPKPTGADDNQVPALTPVAALCAFYPSASLSNADIERAIRVTNNSDMAVSCGLYFAQVLKTVLGGKSITDSFAEAAGTLPQEIKEKMEEALNMPATELDAAANLFGQPCGLENTMPLAAYILANSASFKQATEMNILAGGDSCGRAMMLGAIAGAFYGIGAEKGIPYNWLLRLKRQQDIAALLA